MKKTTERAPGLLTDALYRLHVLTDMLDSVIWSEKPDGSSAMIQSTREFLAGVPKSRTKSTASPKSKTTYTPGPWRTWELAPDVETYGKNAGRVIVTTQDGEVEICGPCPRDPDARVISWVPELMDASRDTIQRFDELLSRWDAGDRDVEDEISKMSSAINRLEQVRNDAMGTGEGT